MSTLNITTNLGRARLFTLLLVLHAAHVTLVASLADRTRLSAANVLPSLAVNLVWLGVGVWGVLALLRGGTRVPAYVLGILGLLGTTVSLGFLAAGAREWCWALVVAIDVVYWICAVWMLVALGTPDRRPDE